MIKVPVTIGFDHDKVIGLLEVDETQLPSIPDYHFALGYRVLDAKVVGGTNRIEVSKYELVNVGLVLDPAFKNYHA